MTADSTSLVEAVRRFSPCIPVGAAGRRAQAAFLRSLRQDALFESGHEQRDFLDRQPETNLEETQMDISTVLRRHEDDLLANPNVNAVCIGERGGRADIKVMVARKGPEGRMQRGGEGGGGKGGWRGGRKGGG